MAGGGESSGLVNGKGVSHEISLEGGGSTASVGAIVVTLGFPASAPEPAPPTPTAATILFFRVSPDAAGQQTATWQTGVEWAVIGFLVEELGLQGWVRAHSHLVPASGFGRPTTYRIALTPPTGYSSQRFRLKEVDLAGKAKVVAETEGQPEVAVSIRASRSDLGLRIRGIAGQRVEVQVAYGDPKDEWQPFRALTLDDRGSADVPIQPPSNAPVAFFRLVLP